MTITLDSSAVQGWGSDPAARVVRVSRPREREIKLALERGEPVLVTGCPDDRTGQIGVPSVRRVVSRRGMLVTRTL